jgi:magnesium chelatase family protein
MCHPSALPTSTDVAARVAEARSLQIERFKGTAFRCNADLSGGALDELAAPDGEGRALLTRVADRFGLSARGYHRVLRVARTIADLDGSQEVRKSHVAEAVSYRVGALAAV